jgi:arsenate reductase
MAGERIVVHSAGTAPSDVLNPAVVEVMGEKGIDIIDHRPQVLTQAMGLNADVIITMGCGDVCPVYPGRRYLDWELSDPVGKSVDEIRAIRDEIEQRVATLVEELLASTS